MIKLTKKLAILSAVPLLFAAATAAATVVFSTNFDSVVVPAGSYVILPSVEGWTATAGDGIEVQNHAAGSPYSETNLVELDSNNNSTMQRVISDAGTYTLNFFYSPRPNVPASSNGINVLLNGVSLLNITGAGSGNTNWSSEQLVFTTGAASTLAFSAVGTSDSLGGYLDNISLVASVPEPSTWGMMLIGFGAIGFSMRRRRTGGQSLPQLA